MIYTRENWLLVCEQYFDGRHNWITEGRFKLIAEWIRQGKPDPETFTPWWRHKVSKRSRASL